jgi:hypothetical protein
MDIWRDMEDTEMRMGREMDVGSRWRWGRNTEMRMKMEMESSGYQQQQRSILAISSSFGCGSRNRCCLGGTPRTPYDRHTVPKIRKDYWWVH